MSLEITKIIESLKKLEGGDMCQDCRVCCICDKPLRKGDMHMCESCREECEELKKSSQKQGLSANDKVFRELAQKLIKENLK